MNWYGQVWMGNYGWVGAGMFGWLEAEQLQPGSNSECRFFWGSVEAVRGATGS